MLCLRDTSRQLFLSRFINEFKNKLDKMLRKRKLEFFNNRFEQIKNNTRENWKVINELLGRRKIYRKVDMIEDANGGELNNPISISNAFCKYFSSVAQNLSDSIPVTNADPLSYIPNTRAASLFVYPATIGEVVDIIACLPNKGGNVDSIPMSVYKNISDIIAPIIVDIFNSSVSEGVFPDVLKVARVVPIF